jgi:hypothetical protein
MGVAPFDVGIIKFTPNGANKVWATFLAAAISRHRQQYDRVMRRVNLIVLGRTYSTDFPFKTTAGSGGGADIFVAKINAAGNSMIGCPSGRRQLGTTGSIYEDQLRDRA